MFFLQKTLFFKPNTYIFQTYLKYDIVRKEFGEIAITRPSSVLEGVANFVVCTIGMGINAAAIGILCRQKTSSLFVKVV